MNIVLDNAVELNNKTKTSKTIGPPTSSLITAHRTTGRILLKGDNITLIQAVTPLPSA